MELQDLKAVLWLEKWLLNSFFSDAESEQPSRTLVRYAPTRMRVLTSGPLGSVHRTEMVVGQYQQEGISVPASVLQRG